MHVYDSSVLFGMIGSRKECVSSLFIYVCPSICVIVATCVCMHVLHVCVNACIQSQQLMMIHGYILNMATQDVS